MTETESPDPKAADAVPAEDPAVDGPPPIATEPPKDGFFPVLLRFFLVPLILVGASVGVFAMLGALVAQGDPSTDDLLNRIAAGGKNARWHAAQELSNRVANRKEGEPDLTGDPAFVAGVIRTTERVLESGDDPRIFEHLSIFLAASKRPEAADVLREAATASDPDVRFFAVHALARLGEAAAMDAVLDRLGDTEPGVRAMAAWSAGSLAKETGGATAAAIREPLGKALADATVDVQMNAALALGRNGLADGADLIWKMLHPEWIRANLAPDGGGLGSILRRQGSNPVTPEQLEDTILLNALAVTYVIKDRSMIEGVRALGASHRSPKVQDAALEVAKLLEQEVAARGAEAPRAAPSVPAVQK
ncbi:MAG: HEAT repeat domain-containing protein [Planctomycetota bacterium]|jgi:hypothetical protein